MQLFEPIEQDSISERSDCELVNNVLSRFANVALLDGSAWRTFHEFVQRFRNDSAANLAFSDRNARRAAKTHVFSPIKLTRPPIIYQPAFSKCGGRGSVYKFGSTRQSYIQTQAKQVGEVSRAALFTFISHDTRPQVWTLCMCPDQYIGLAPT